MTTRLDHAHWAIGQMDAAAAKTVYADLHRMAATITHRPTQRKAQRAADALCAMIDLWDSLNEVDHDTAPEGRI